MGDSGPPSPKKRPFFGQKWLKNANFWPKTVFFWAGVVSLTPPHPILQVLDSKKHLLQDQG